MGNPSQKNPVSVIAGLGQARLLRILACVCLGLFLVPSPVESQDRERTVGTKAGGQTIVPTREYHLGEENKLEIAVNIWGEVGAPGSYRVADDTDIVKLISLAGGPTDYANLGHIKITRPNGAGEKLIDLNLLRYLEGEANEDPMVLLPGDTVRVPRNAKHTWRSAIKVISDVAVIATLYVLIADGRYR